MAFSYLRRHTWLHLACQVGNSRKRDFHRGMQMPGEHEQDLEVRDPPAKISQNGLCKVRFVLQDKSTVSLHTMLGGSVATGYGGARHTE